MSDDGALDLVTGAFSYSGSRIAERLLTADTRVRTLTAHPDRPHPLAADVEPFAYRFDDPVALTRSLEGVRTLYNTYWVRFDHGPSSFANAIENSRTLFFAARRAGVSRIVHLSITNPSIASPLPYFRGKALVERALAESGVPYSVVRPTWIFGGSYDILANNIAWILRRLPAFALPGDGRYLVQPVHVDDLARICVEAAQVERDQIIDAAGPETMPFRDLVALVRSAVATRSAIVHVHPRVMGVAARALGVLVRDVVLTPDEIRGLTQGLLVSRAPPLGTIAFSEWLERHRASLGRSYNNELDRHYAVAASR
ncbi:MAG TPA: NAD-dependent epimerase/dehydratase family protein [Solirubrobacteraceae bacterium]|nr:NAD-dependent epimerase/dehydratase family protein [Solirubrobacteraceae bacterium]